jgi:hypothetical protein
MYLENILENEQKTALLLLSEEQKLSRMCHIKEGVSCFDSCNQNRPVSCVCDTVGGGGGGSGWKLD